MTRKNNYLISIKGGGKNREINLSSATFKFGVASILIGAMLFVGSFGYSIYSALYKQKNFDSVAEIQKANELQQEQLLKISKKAEEMDLKLQDLARQEENLRLQAGLKPPKEDPLDATKISAEAENPDADKNSEAEDKNSEAEKKNHDGQGGPIAELKISDVAEALDMIEKRVAIRKESLDAFQAELIARSEDWKKSADTSTSSPTTSESYSGGWVLKNNPAARPSFSAPALNSVPSTSQSIDWSKFQGNPSANSNTPSIWPATGVVTSPYGLRWGGSDFHPGMDIANDLGTPIVATADGVVEFAGWDSGGYGNMVDINHGNGILTRYGHASQILVSVGQSVKRGQIIAYMGSTGFSTGPHVHYEVHVNGQKVNPINYL